jgi:hypothetical protein
MAERLQESELAESVRVVRNRYLALEQALRLIRDTCPGVACRIATRALLESGIEDPEEPNEF